jgi:hypothetical protein
VDAYLHEIQYSGKIVELLKKLRIRALDHQEKQYPLNFLVNFYFKAGDLLPSDHPALVDIPMRFLLPNLIIELLRPLPIDNRANIISSSLNETEAIFASVSLIS